MIKNINLTVQCAQDESCTVQVQYMCKPEGFKRIPQYKHFMVKFSKYVSSVFNSKKPNTNPISHSCVLSCRVEKASDDIQHGHSQTVINERPF